MLEDLGDSGMSGWNELLTGGERKRSPVSWREFERGADCVGLGWNLFGCIRGR